MSRAPRTLLEVCVSRAGGGWRDIARGTQACTFISEWALASWDADRPLDMTAFCEWWGYDERGSAAQRKAYRRLDKFRELFPDHDTPQTIVDALARPRQMPRDSSGVMMLPLAGALAA